MRDTKNCQNDAYKPVCRVCISWLFRHTACCCNGMLLPVIMEPLGQQQYNFRQRCLVMDFDYSRCPQHLPETGQV